MESEETETVPEFPPAPTEASDIISSGAGEKMEEIQATAEGEIDDRRFCSDGRFSGGEFDC